jgi:acyl carrier protein
MANLYGNLVDIIAEQLGTEADRIRSTDTFHSLGIDSLSSIELWFVIEDRWGIEKDTVDNGMHQTLGDLAHQLEQQIHKRSMPDKPVFIK